MSNYRIHAPTTHKLFASRTRRSLRGGHSLGFWNWDHVEKFSIRIRGWRFLEGWKDSKAVSRRVNLGRASTEAKIEAVERPLTRQRYISFSLGRRGNLRRRERTVYSSAWTKFESLKVPWYPADSRYAIDRCCQFKGLAKRGQRLGIGSIRSRLSCIGSVIRNLRLVTFSVRT